MVLAHRNLNSDFVKDFMLRNVMRHYQGSQIASLSLRNTLRQSARSRIAKARFGYGSASRGPGGSGRDPFR